MSEHEIITVWEDNPGGTRVEWNSRTGSVQVKPNGALLTPEVSRRTIEEVGGAPPRYAETDLRALALEHAVHTHHAADGNTGEQIVTRAENFLKFLKGSN